MDAPFLPAVIVSAGSYILARNPLFWMESNMQSYSNLLWVYIAQFSFYMAGIYLKGCM